MRKTFVATLVAVAALSGTAFADRGPVDLGPTTPAENAWVAKMRADISHRYPTAASAEKAGYVRYTGVDPTGSISYANQHWTSDPTHPSQLWYDKRGTLLGADFSLPKTGNDPPQRWGIKPGRWSYFLDHIHYVLRDPKTGALQYDNYIYPEPYAKAGGDPKHPDAAGIVKAGRAKSASDVVTVFDYPTIWDLLVWIKPNPKGPFADDNPLMGKGKFWGQ